MSKPVALYHIKTADGVSKHLFTQHNATIYCEIHQIQDFELVCVFSQAIVKSRGTTLYTEYYEIPKAEPTIWFVKSEV